MGKIIDLTSRLKTQSTINSVNLMTESVKPSSQIVNFTDHKQQILFHERRQAKRSVLSEIVSAMVVLPEKGLMKVSLYDISEEGLSFDLEAYEGHFKVDEEVVVRVYLNQKTYFPVTLKIKHVTLEATEGVMRHGATFLRGVSIENSPDAALQYFIRFIESAGSGLKKDDGDLMAPKTS